VYALIPLLARVYFSVATGLQTLHFIQQIQLFL